MIRKLTLLAMMGTLMLVSACEKQGPIEKAGEEVDEAVGQIKNGGEKTTGEKVDDAADHVREGVQDAADEAKN